MDQASIYEQALAGEIRCGLAAEEGDDGADLLRAADATHGNGRRLLGEVRLGRDPCGRGLHFGQVELAVGHDMARQERVHGDAIPGRLQGLSLIHI